MIKLKEMRLNKGLKQKELADLLHVSLQTISGYETSYAQPPIDNLIKLADIFGVSIDELVGRTNIIGITEIKNELSTDENKLLKDFRACPAAEQRVLLDYADMLYSRVEKEKKKVERF